MDSGTIRQVGMWFPITWRALFAEYPGNSRGISERREAVYLNSCRPADPPQFFSGNGRHRWLVGGKIQTFAAKTSLLDLHHVGSQVCGLSLLSAWAWSPFRDGSVVAK